ncbi:hypothetical protein M2175_004600 [Bradyrhizobium elkanii]|uniref:hypothetical protein n=1 Tax=Bradyrhizobium TaxID=374 RepID=UPI00216751E4|nr:MULTISPECIES: hypothetical protein [Bradyrhizobium]MCS3929569.1 hypothetical protein [Bradyrhizobium elkanii]MCS3970126.1 hypothetical protein [Bradyrhizobium japonicum]
MLDSKKLRNEATEARQMADAAGNQQDKDFWLGIAEGWLKLARETDELKGKRP